MSARSPLHQAVTALEAAASVIGAELVARLIADVRDEADFNAEMAESFADLHDVQCDHAVTLLLLDIEWDS